MTDSIENQYLEYYFMTDSIEKQYLEYCFMDDSNNNQYSMYFFIPIRCFFAHSMTVFLDLTDRLIQVGKIVNTPVLDHLIITPDKYYSFGDEGDMARLALSTKWEPTFITIERTRERAERIGRELGREEGLVEGEKIGMQKGEQIGAERGRKEGAERERSVVAAEMRRKGIAVDTICEITGLSKQEIEQIS